MNDFILKMNAHKERKMYYMDTDSMYIHYSDYKKYLSNKMLLLVKFGNI